VPSQPAPALERGRFTHGTCPGAVSGRTTWLVLPLVVSVSSGPTWARPTRIFSNDCIHACYLHNKLAAGFVNISTAWTTKWELQQGSLDQQALWGGANAPFKSYVTVVLMLWAFSLAP
jgi:hypothetical protein